MITHVVLFTPRSNLTADEVGRLGTALDAALANIPSVRRYRMGRRIRLGTEYDAAAPLKFDYLLTVEFDNRDGLAAYLQHNQHQTLGRMFYEFGESALALDFETVDRDLMSAIAEWNATAP